MVESLRFGVQASGLGFRIPVSGSFFSFSCLVFRDCRRWRSNPSGKGLQRLTRDTVTDTMRKAARPSRCARCGAGAGCSAKKYQSLFRDWSLPPVHRLLRWLFGNKIPISLIFLS